MKKKISRRRKLWILLEIKIRWI